MAYEMWLRGQPVPIVIPPRFRRALVDLSGLDCTPFHTQRGGAGQPCPGCEALERRVAELELRVQSLALRLHERRPPGLEGGHGPGVPP
jgi:hypothetical protein